MGTEVVPAIVFRVSRQSRSLAVTTYSKKRVGGKNAFVAIPNYPSTPGFYPCL